MATTPDHRDGRQAAEDERPDRPTAHEVREMLLAARGDAVAGVGGSVKQSVEASIAGPWRFTDAVVAELVYLVQRVEMLERRLGD